MPAVGDVIAFKYKVERILGVGGMGVVLAARHMQLGQRVAIKFIRDEGASDASAVSRFLREARSAVALSSEHVTKVLDVGTLESGAPYIVMEYLAGEDLGEALRRDGPMAVPDAIGKVLQACEALAEAHAAGIVHRDLKPSNLFVTTRRDGSALVKVLDFGIAKMAELNIEGALETLTASGLVMGSPAYMSPEQVRNAKDVDARSDIWALGVILYELVTGVAPFTGTTLGETLAQIVSESPPSIRTLRPDVPEAFAAVISHCLKRPVHERIQSVGELAARLSPFAPREAALSVERILRMSAAHPDAAAGGSGQSTLLAPSFDDQEISPSGRVGERAETSRAWLKSGTRPGAPSSSRRSRLTLLAAGAVAGLVVVAALLAAGAGRSPTSGSAAAVAVPAPLQPTIERPASPGPAVVRTEPSAVVESPPLPPPAVDAVDARPRSETVDAGVTHPASRAAPVPHGARLANPASDVPLDDLLNRRQ
jgi:serine/threonine protein kinase